MRLSIFSRIVSKALVSPTLVPSTWTNLTSKFTVSWGAYRRYIAFIFVIFITVVVAFIFDCTLVSSTIFLDAGRHENTSPVNLIKFVG